MQQFARRPEPEETPSPAPSNEVLSQLLEQIAQLSRHVEALSEEVSNVKAENARLQSQIGQWTALQAAPVVNETRLSEAEEASADEESLIEPVRTSPVPEDSIAEQPDAPMSDDEIQRLLSEAAMGAIDASEEPVHVEAAPDAQAEPVIAEPEETVSLRLVEDEPVVEKPTLSFEPDYALARKVPGNLAIAALAVPHRMEGAAMVVKAPLPFDRAALDVLADAVACEVVPEVAPIEEVVAALRLAYADEAVEAERDAVFSEPVRGNKRGLAGLFRRSA